MAVLLCWFRMIICVDIGGTSTKVGLLDATGQLHSFESIPTKPDVESYFDSLAALIERHVATSECTGIGVAIAGFLSLEKDRLLYNSNLSWLEGFPLRSRLASLFNLPIELETDSNSACMAEYHFGCGKNSRRFLCVTVGTGLGVGLTVDGQPLRFSYGCLGDIGHIIVQPQGRLCSCGGRGCAEALVSAPALARRFADRSGLSDITSLRDVIEAAHGGDRTAIQVLEEAGIALGVAIASMANILFPDHIAIAGGLSAAGVHVLDNVERVFRESAGVFTRSNVAITPAHLGPSATLIGAGWPFWPQSR